MQFRIDNPERIDSEAIVRQHRTGDEIIVQFSNPCYSEKLLRQINELCERFTSNFQVRFYGHYQGAFDCGNLRFLPAVRSLAVDCLQAVENHRSLTELPDLDELSLGVYLLDDPQILGGENFKNLKELTISETKKRNIDLSHLADYRLLRSLFVGGQTKGIDAIAQLTALDELRLGQIGKTVPLGFVNKMANLGSLKLILGGRANIDEIQHGQLKTLSVVRVQGFESFNSSALPGLQDLHIEDQIRIPDLKFSADNKNLTKIVIVNCKGLMRVSGLPSLINLNQLRISGTGLNIEEILASGLPPQLKTFAFYTGKSSLNKAIRDRLDELGYKELERAA
jgi:protein phosphatase 1 regulatory subunit 7